MAKSKKPHGKNKKSSIPPKEVVSDANPDDVPVTTYASEFTDSGVQSKVQRVLQNALPASSRASGAHQVILDCDLETSGVQPIAASSHIAQKEESVFKPLEVPTPVTQIEDTGAQRALRRWMPPPKKVTPTEPELVADTQESRPDSKSYEFAEPSSADPLRQVAQIALEQPLSSDDPDFEFDDEAEQQTGIAAELQSQSGIHQTHNSSQARFESGIRQAFASSQVQFDSGIRQAFALSQVQFEIGIQQAQASSQSQFESAIQKAQAASQSQFDRANRQAHASSQFQNDGGTQRQAYDSVKLSSESEPAKSIADILDSVTARRKTMAQEFDIPKLVAHTREIAIEVEDEKDDELSSAMMYFSGTAGKSTYTAELRFRAACASERAAEFNSALKTMQDVVPQNEAKWNHIDDFAPPLEEEPRILPSAKLNMLDVIDSSYKSIFSGPENFSPPRQIEVEIDYSQPQSRLLPPQTGLSSGLGTDTKSGGKYYKNRWSKK
ncbi:MAG: hypothetical protein K2X93_11160 [Candidatus Obscuribacterales bacterium]|nr:hypothetical protein [Candidatus Obscuribacterales bacterium]